MIGEGKFHSSPTSIGAGFLESNLSNVLFYNYYIRYSDESIIVVVVLKNSVVSNSKEQPSEESAKSLPSTPRAASPPSLANL